MGQTTQYVEGGYWESNPTFHEEDAAFKAENCATLLRRESGCCGSRSVLDVGCGAGGFLASLSTRVDGTFLGIDLAEQPIALASDRHRGNGLWFRVADVADVDGPFDLVTMNDVFEHVDDYLGFLRSIRRFQRPGVEFYFNIPLDMTAVAVATRGYMKARERVGHLHYFSKESALATLEYAGFTVRGYRYNRTVGHLLKTRMGLRGLAAAVPRLASFRLAPDLSVRLLGGASLGVLCE